MAEDFRKIKDQLSKRKSDSLAKRFNSPSEQIGTLFLTAANDLGVCRNGGRRGSSYAPLAIMNCLKKMNFHETQRNKEFTHREKSVVNNQRSDNFKEFQKDSIDQINQALTTNSKNVIHLGGGHDHVYPLLKALDKEGKRLVVINIDAHLDTRIDENHHSGTPFRQFAKECIGDFHLIQLGIHDFANGPSNFLELEKGVMSVFTLAEIQKETLNFSQDIRSFIEEVLPNLDEEKDTLVISLDCDALDSSCMEAVSAVNHNGFPLHTVSEIFKFCKEIKPQQTNYLGVYEYNPIYDNLSQKGARALASLIYDFMK